MQNIRDSMTVTYLTHRIYTRFVLYRTDGLATQDIRGLNDFVDHDASKAFLTNNLVDPLHTVDENGMPHASQSTGPYYVPRWQSFPVLERSMTNENLFEDPTLSNIIKDCIEQKKTVLGGFEFAPLGGVSDTHPDTVFFATIASMAAGESLKYLGDPMSHIVIPIFQGVNDTDREHVVAVLQATLHWQDYLRDVLSDTHYGYHVVIETGCDPKGENTFTYQIDGHVASVVGWGDHHDRGLSRHRVDGVFIKDHIQDGTTEGLPYHDDSCPHVFHIYPTQADYDHYLTSLPFIISLVSAAIFAFTIGMFVWFERLVERRQKIVLAKATQSTAIVSSLFVSITKSV